MDENTITTVFKADISQFSSSTQQLNQYIKTVNSEFDVATSTLGKWSDSTDGLTAKITQLNKVLEAEKMKLSDMKKRYEEMVAAVNPSVESDHLPSVDVATSNSLLTVFMY